VARVVEPEAALKAQMAPRLALYRKLYGNLKGTFREFAG
jgi:hypothetical protein